MKVKKQTYNGVFSGYIVNENIFFPKENCEQVKQWIAEGNTPEPEFTDEELNLQEVQVKLTEYKSYLNSTDFYYSRFLEIGEVVPEEVVLKRTKAREYIRANTL